MKATVSVPARARSVLIRQLGTCAWVGSHANVGDRTNAAIKARVLGIV
jgi:hypothetical protein